MLEKQTHTKQTKPNQHQQSHPDHKDSLPRLRKIQGQLEGIMNMISDGRYCVDVITQLRAAAAALKSVEGQVIKRHLRGCMSTAMKSKNTEEIDKKIEELTHLYMRGL